MIENGHIYFTKDTGEAFPVELQLMLEHIPSGLAVYRQEGEQFHVVFRNPAFYRVLGYSKTHITQINNGDSFVGVHPEDLPGLRSKTMVLMKEGGELKGTFRVFHDITGTYHWIHIMGTQHKMEDGTVLFYTVYTDVTEEKQTETEVVAANNKIQDIINAIPGGVAIYRVEVGHFAPTFYSDGLAAIAGYTREEFNTLLQDDVLDIVYEGDRNRVSQAARAAMRTGEILNISYRIQHRDGGLVWVHLNGRRIGTLTENSNFYASFTEITSESEIYQEIASEAADAIYVIDRTSYEVLYFHDSQKLFPNSENCIGKKCYETLQNFSEPCPFCNFKNGISSEESEIVSQWNGRTYRLHVREVDWNGIPAFIQYLRDITKEVEARKEKQHLEQYFQTLVDSLAGGITVVRHQKNDTYIPEYLSAGFADMIGTTPENAWNLYCHDAMSQVHPEDVLQLKVRLKEAATHIGRRCELIYRLRKEKAGYMWIRNTLSMLPREDGDLRLYMFLQDITTEHQEQENIREQYKKLLLHHYQTPGPNALIVGHCNITRNLILEINDYTGAGCIKSFGSNREEFFMALSSLIIEPNEKQKFLEMYLNTSMLKAYQRKETEQIISCMIQLPNEKTGRYVQCKVNLVEEPDTGDITGILTMTDITDQVVADQVLKRLSDTGYDHIIVLDLLKESYHIFSSDINASCVPEKCGSYPEWTAYLLENRILPKDRENYKKYMDTDYIATRLKESGAYTFDFSIIDEEENIRVKRVAIFAIDLRLGRVGLSQTDVTETVREQQSLLNMLAYTFELAAFIDVSTKRMTMHTRQTVLEDLSPMILEDYDAQVKAGMVAYSVDGQKIEEVSERFRMNYMLEQLEKQPLGYDFVYAYQEEGEERYKKINILWGDRNHQTICIVRADVTEMLAEERKNKQGLENALMLANQANQAKSAFLSSMSHDIRTPMNAIMGMTTLASAHPDDPSYVIECLEKISVSSKHLLNLINDVLDMSQIEHDGIKLSREHLSIQEVINQISTMILPQAKQKNQQFTTEIGKLSHHDFYGDSLRINQIFINILGNAVKFTPERGSVDFFVEECTAVKEGNIRYRFSVQDTGIGISPEALSHIFEPFTRGPHAQRIEGTGLGLSITKGLVERMGGIISVESREGEGSLFRVELEFEPGQEGQTANIGTKVQALSGETGFLCGCRFLIAEDNEINAEILESLLEMYGAMSLVENNGVRVVETFSAASPGTFDAILMDIQMPMMNGYEAARAIRAMKRADAHIIPIIAMTANAFSEDVQAAIDAGMNAHVAKPIDLEVLNGVLRTVLDKKMIAAKEDN